MFSSRKPTAIKKPRLLYYLENLESLVVPTAFFRARRLSMLQRIPDSDRAYIQRRADHYNQLKSKFDPGTGARPFRLNLFASRRNYAMDLYRYTRYFDPAFRLNYIFGDVIDLPAVPSIVKARPISENNQHAVLFNLNKVRHFVFVNDQTTFRDKKNMAVWRGNSFQEPRKVMLRKHFDNKRCDVGHARRRESTGPWSKPFLTIPEQLQFKFIISIEGNDVATNLKWVMSSNSLCLMPRPKRETWFMESTLVPGKHYALVRDDFSDLDEVMDYYISRPVEAEEIIRHAQEYVSQFMDSGREDAIALLVLEKYFRLSGQM